MEVGGFRLVFTIEDAKKLTIWQHVTDVSITPVSAKNGGGCGEEWLCGRETES